MCEKEKIKDMPKIVTNERHERNAIMKDFDKLHEQVMEFLNELTEKHNI